MKVKMAISHALAQSSKLALYEERMVGLIEEVRAAWREGGRALGRVFEEWRDK